MAESRVTSLCERIYGIDPKTVPKVVATKDPFLPALTYEAGIAATPDTSTEGGVHKSFQGCSNATSHPPQDGTADDQVKAATTKEGFVKIEQELPTEDKSGLLQGSCPQPRQMTRPVSKPVVNDWGRTCLNLIGRSGLNAITKRYWIS